MKKIAALGIVIVLALVVLSGCLPKEIRTVKIEMGPLNAPRQNPDIERVKRNLELAEKAYPNNPEVFQYWGRIYAMEEKYPEMAKALARSDSLDPKGALKKGNDAIRQIEWEKLFNKAKVAAQNKEYDKAFTLFQNSGMCWPERYESWINAAVMAQQLNDTTGAYESSSRAYAIAPDTMVVLENHASICVFARKFVEAEAVYKKILAKDPTNAEVMFSIGAIYMELGDTVHTIEIYTKALDVDKTNADGWWNVGLLYSRIKDYCQAADCFKHVLTLSPDDKEASINYLKALMYCAQKDTSSANAATNKGYYETAKTELEKFTAANPDNCDGWNLLFQAYLKLGKGKEANAAYKRYEECEKN